MCRIKLLRSSRIYFNESSQRKLESGHSLIDDIRNMKHKTGKTKGERKLSTNKHADKQTDARKAGRDQESKKNKRRRGPVLKTGLSVLVCGSPPSSFFAPTEAPANSHASQANPAKSSSSGERALIIVPFLPLCFGKFHRSLSPLLCCAQPIDYEAWFRAHESTERSNAIFSPAGCGEFSPQLQALEHVSRRNVCYIYDDSM